MPLQYIKYSILTVLLILSIFAAKASIVINEFMASNGSSLFDENEETPDWIELFNNSSETINLEGWYLTDDEADLKKWKFPAVNIAPNGFLIVLASGEDRISESELHSNFKLAADGEAIILSKAEGVIVDAFEFGQQQKDHSMGRLDNGVEGWGVFTKSSPGESNLLGILAESESTKISFSHEPGQYSESIDLSLHCIDTELKIYYTTNGDIPTSKDLLFEEAFQLTANNAKPSEISFIPTSKVWQAPIGVFPQLHVIRARAFKNDLPVSKVYTQSFFINNGTKETFSFPIISLITEQHNLFDYESGIYIIGKAYNFNKRGKEWERPAQIEYFNEHFDLGFRQDLGLRVTGNSSRNFPQKSLKLYARSEYGDNRIRYPLFGENYDSTFKRIKLRNLNGDRNITGITDDLAHAIIQGEVNTDYSQRQFVIVFINGIYWGIHSMRESLDEHLFSQKFNVDDGDISIGHAHKFGIDTVNGSLDDYHEVLDFVRSRDVNEPENYAYLSSQIDIDNLQELFIAQTFLANSDWPHHNNRFWKIDNNESKWRWMFFDLDAALKASNYDNFGLMFQSELEASQFVEPEDYELINALMQCNAFVLSFRAKMYQMLDTTFSPERTIPILENLIDEVAPEMESHIRRWHYPHSMERWFKDLSNIRDFLVRRPHFLNEELSNRLGNPIRTFPNPASSILNIELESTENQEINIELVNAVGNVFPLAPTSITEGKQIIEFDLPDSLEPGMHFLKVQMKRRVLIETLLIL